MLVHKDAASTMRGTMPELPATLSRGSGGRHSRPVSASLRIRRPAQGPRLVMHGERYTHFPVGATPVSKQRRRWWGILAVAQQKVLTSGLLGGGPRLPCRPLHDARPPPALHTAALVDVRRQEKKRKTNNKQGGCGRLATQRNTTRAQRARQHVR